MENKNEIGIIDQLNTPSITRTEPMFQVKNVFRPTSKNFVIIGTMMKLISVGVVTGAASLMVLEPKLGFFTLIGAVIFGAVGEGLILFTKEEPLSSLIRAAEDINLQQDTTQTQVTVTPPNTTEYDN